ncbi:MAG: hypothetical protein U0939_04745 [Pirellulales bacterium]
MRRHCEWLVSLCLVFGGLAFGDRPTLAVASPPGSRQETVTTARTLEQLRAAGPAGLERLLAQRRELEQSLAVGADAEAVQQQIAALDQQLDFVGGALRTAQSQLYWYTDLQEAQQAAQRTGRPILHLRLLGKLTDEYSCANSRFFRSLLYSNDDIARYLRAHYILSWQTVRNAPRITIDFGDGRTIERTITGNSIHYVLSSDGTVIDALPGLYGPQAFLKRLEAAAEWSTKYHAAPPEARQSLLVRHHVEQMLETAKRWHADLEAIEAPFSRDGVLLALPQGPIRIRDEADLESCLKQFGDERTAADALARHLGWLNQTVTETQWRQIAMRHADEAKIDEATRERMRAERPMAAAAGRLAMTKRVVEDPMLRLVRNLEGVAAFDTVRNDYALRCEILSLIARNPATMTRVDPLNEIVYDEVFLMPLHDPWLGLAPADVYTGLPDAGTRSPRVAERR